jgi:predicted acetyltransferase
MHLYEAFLEMAADYRSAGEPRYQRPGAWTPADFQLYLRELAERVRGVGVPAGGSPVITRWLVDGADRIAGVSRLRTVLTPELENEGGNIGYDVPPSRRRQGFGTELLRLTLVEARARGLDRVLVTCNTDNVASRRIIEGCGGMLASEGTSDEDGRPVLRFWIALPGGSGSA